MISASARLLRLVSVLAARPSWTCAELAERTGVTERTVRRDVARLREIGYVVDSEPGPWGGYRLRAGSRVPPLILDDEEALAVAVGLREAALSGALGGDQAALSALLKLRQVLPRRIAERLEEMDAAFVHTPRASEPQITSGMLLELAAACRRGERARLAYRDGQGRATVRDVDPYRLVHTGRRWYFVARDVARDQWRTFRADRVEHVQPTGQPVAPADPPDPAHLVSRSTASGPYPLTATIRLPLPMEESLRLIPATVGAHRPDGPGATVVDVGGPDADGLARYLLGLAVPLRVLAPAAVREALVRRTRELLAANADGGEYLPGAHRADGGAYLAGAHRADGDEHPPGTHPTGGDAYVAGARRADGDAYSAGAHRPDGDEAPSGAHRPHGVDPPARHPGAAGPGGPRRAGERGRGGGQAVDTASAKGRPGRA